MSIMIININWRVYIIMENFFKKNEKDKEEEKRVFELISAIEMAKLDMDTAIELFNLVSEPKLIDCAIYEENAARARYTYLLNQAKNLGVKVDNSYIIEKSAV